MKRKYFSIILIIILILGASMAWGSSETTNLKLTKPGKGDRNWGQTVNDNMDKIDSEIATIRSKSDDLPEVYVYTGTFNSTTGYQITLPKAVGSVNEYAVKVTPTSRAGAIGDIYVTKTTSNFTVKCSEANTTDTFTASLYYIGDVSAYGSSIYRKWYVSPNSNITDHADSSQTGSLAWVQAQISTDQAAVELVGNKVYQLRQNLTINDNIQLNFQKGGIIDTDFSIRDSNYQWNLSGLGTNEYYLQASGGGNPNVSQPAVAIENNEQMAEGNAGSLSAGEWDWNDNDSLGYTTIYVRLSDSADPDGKPADYVEAGYTLTLNCIIDQTPNQKFMGNGIVAGNPVVEATIPEWWGAIGDGTTEDYTAVNAALTHWYQRTLPGVFRFLSGKDYLVSTAISKTLTKNLQGAWTIEGYGSKITSGVTSGTLFTLTTPSSGAQHFSFRGLEIYGSGSGDSLLTLNGGDDINKYFYGVSVRDVYLVNFEGKGLSILGNFFESSIENVHARGKSTNTTGYGIYAYNGGGTGVVSSVTIRNCVTDYGLYGIYVKTPTGDVKVQECTSIRAQQYGIFLESNFGSQALNNHLEQNWQSVSSVAQGQAGLYVVGSGSLIGNYGVGNYQANVVRVSVAANAHMTIVEGLGHSPVTHYAYITGGVDSTVTLIGNLDYWENDDAPNVKISRIGYTYKNLELVATSGTGEDDLMSYTLPDDNLGKTEGLRITAFGQKGGSAGNKTIKFYFGSTVIAFHAAANNTNDWRFVAEILNYRDDTDQYISWVGYDGSTVTQGYDQAAEDTTGGDITIKFTGECADAADTVYQNALIIERF